MHNHTQCKIQQHDTFQLQNHTIMQILFDYGDLQQESEVGGHDFFFIQMGFLAIEDGFCFQCCNLTLSFSLILL